MLETGMISNKKMIDAAAYLYAHSNFQIRKFNDSYIKILFEEN